MSIKDMMAKKLIVFGYDPLQERDLREYSRELSDLLRYLPANKNLPGSLTQAKVVKKAKNFLGALGLNLHDVYVSDTKVLMEQLANASSTEEVIQIIQSVSNKEDPFEIPIIITNGHSMVGELVKGLVIPLATNDELKRMPVPMCHIKLGSNLTKISSATYVHELTHSQLESLKGAVRDYHNKEVLPIFFERIAADEISPELARTSDLMRLRHLKEELELGKLYYASKGHISYPEKVEHDMYVISILKAYNLYDLYKESTDEVKKEILANIQQIFDGKQTLEEFLDKFGIEESTKGVKNHLK